MTDKGCAYPEKVVTTAWAAEHLNDPITRDYLNKA